MANRGLVPANSQQHNVPKLLAEGKYSLRALARACFVTGVAGQAPSTIGAWRRDLSWFFAFYAGSTATIIAMNGTHPLRRTDEGAGNPHPPRELLAQLRGDLSLEKER